MLLLIVGIMVVVDLFVLFSDIMQLGELMIRDLSRYSTKMLNYSLGYKRTAASRLVLCRQPDCGSAWQLLSKEDDARCWTTAHRRSIFQAG